MNLLNPMTSGLPILFLVGGIVWGVMTIALSPKSDRNREDDSDIYTIKDE